MAFSTSISVNGQSANKSVFRQRKSFESSTHSFITTNTKYSHKQTVRSPLLLYRASSYKPTEELAHIDNKDAVGYACALETTHRDRDHSKTHSTGRENATSSKAKTKQKSSATARKRIVLN